MKVAVFNGPRDIEFVEREIPKPKDKEILIKVEASAICTWEQRVYLGIKEVPFPFVGGHEIAAKIVELGENVDKRNWAVGDQVIFGSYLACGGCYQCKIGNQQNCEYFDHTQPIPRSDLIGMGGFSEYLIAEQQYLFKYKNVEPVEAALTEPVTCCIHSIESSNIEFGDIVLVMGCGIMGLLHVQLALKKGAVVIASDFNQERLNLAKELGAHYIFNKSGDLKEYINLLTNNRGVQHIFNTIAVAEVVEELMPLLAINGNQVLYSSFYPDVPASIGVDSLHKRANRIIGTANSNPRDFMRALSMIEHKVINLKPFVSEVYKFEDIEAAFEKAVEGNAYRVVLRM